ncbi:hypothetical protein EW146_g4269 [Bondarzewia mesenterica]|uniref:Exoribonuclease phosphorolytic domain-containing protein n=1 Tax=Bondarzewia mesenterica TaxID=1095465 RepID=A0A4S4LVK0_9AGAM|nr:hypothetical protein EW146_g4269 [Bondarzewia mesenterica]
MAQSAFDRRRINGPEESFPPVFDASEDDDAVYSTWKVGDPRQGRDPLDIRPIFLKAGLISQANGSAYIETERTKVACAVSVLRCPLARFINSLVFAHASYGPRQSKNIAYSEIGRLNIEVKFTPFSCGRRRAPLRDAEDRSVAVLVQQALTPSVRLELLPKSVIDIFITVVESDGTDGCVAAASVAASTALADAGIELFGLVVSCSASFMGREIWLDPTEEEAQRADGSLIYACIPALGTVTNVWQAGRILPQDALQTKVLKVKLQAFADPCPYPHIHTTSVKLAEVYANRISCEASMTSTSSPMRDTNQYPSPPHSRSSNDSDESLRALEFSEGLDPTARPRRERSYSLSGFGFERDLLPLSASLSEPDEARVTGSEKDISLMNGIALVVGLQIGSGIFSSPGVVVANTGSVGASLSVWLLSGLLAWTGASSFAELGSAIPLNGGAQAYLAYSYGPLISYLFAWTAIAALKPGSNAVISLIFAEYMNRLFWHATVSDAPPDAIPQWAIQVTAVVAVLIVTIVCIATRNLGTRAAVIFTTVKIISLISVTVLGLVQLIRGRATTSLTTNLFEGSSTSPSSYALALYSGLWAFDGWDQANYVGGEIKHPEKNIPRAIHSSMIIVTVLFLLANLSYFVVLDKNTVGLSNTVALDFGRALFGPVGGSVFAAMVAFSCFGALNGSFFTSGRLIYAAGREGYLPALFGRLHKTRQTPLNAMCLQAAITIMFIAFGGGFRSLINFAVVASWAFYFLTVLGLVILRIKEPKLERPYRTWITTPLIFCAVALFLLCMPIIAAPLEAMAVLGFVLVGIPVYYITQRETDIHLPGKFASLSSWISSMRGRPAAAPGFGWEAVATEGDEGMEMVQNQNRPRR